MSINKQAVINMFNSYHTKVVNNPTLFTNKRDGDRAVVVSLPIELIEYANRGAGHHGHGSGATPVGIRKSCSHAPSFLAKIFSSVESLEEFIKSSECDADEYIAEVRARHAGKSTAQIITVDPLDRKMDSYILDQLYGKGTTMMLRTKFPKTVMNDYRTLTRREFEGRYNLVAVAEAV